MTADLYICDKTFSHNGEDSVLRVCEKIVNIGGVLEAVRTHKDENNLYVQTERFLETTLLPNNIKIRDLVIRNSTNKRHEIPRDVLNILMTIFSAPRCGFSYNDMLDVLMPEYENKDYCNGIIAMNEIKEINESHQVLYNRDGFYTFRRHFIAKYPKDAKTFLQDIDKYFDRLVLRKDRDFMESHVKEVIHRAEDIIHCLSVLNDSFIKDYKSEERKRQGNLDAFLDFFAKKYSIYGGSVGGSIKKRELSCYFEGWEGEHYCGSHLKFQPGNSDKDKGYLRIYFCWDKNNLEKVYVGLICQHAKDSRTKHKNRKIS